MVEARKNLRRGRKDYFNNIDSWYALEYSEDNLQNAVQIAQEAYDQRKQDCTAVLLNLGGS